MNRSLSMGKFVALGTLIACFTSPALAGKGASTNACVNLAVAPQKPVIFNFTPVATNCMNDSGNSASLTATQAGVTCTSIGYVEAKGSGGCAFESSTWNLSYSSSGSPWSGSTQSTWATGSGITLNSYSPQTAVNTSPAASTATQMNWNDQGPIYIIFTPGATSTNATAQEARSEPEPAAATVPPATAAK